MRRIVKPPADAAILEIGSGTGHNLAMLGQFGRVDATELDPEARELSTLRLGRSVVEAALPDLSMLPADYYDVIALLDVLEHVVDDQSSLNAIATRMRPGGKLILTVPANKWMWSAHDKSHHHHRRYIKSEIVALARKSGFVIKLLTPFNSILFPPIAAARIIGKWRGKEQADDDMPSRPINSILDFLFGCERWMIDRIPMPFGVSLLAVLQRPV